MKGNLINNIIKVFHIQSKMLTENHTKPLYRSDFYITGERLFLFYTQSLAGNSASGKILKHLLTDQIFYSSGQCICYCKARPLRMAGLLLLVHPLLDQHLLVCMLSHFSRAQLFATPWTVQPARLFCPWNSPGKNTGVGCHALLQGNFLSQGLNPPLSLSSTLAGGFFTTSAT